MKIERFRIQGFKSITDITVDGLSDINVFFGLNDVGKSNIFQALDMLYGLLKSKQWFDNTPVPEEYSLEQLEQSFGQALFQAGGNNVIQIEMDLLLESTIENSPRIAHLSARLQLRHNNIINIEFGVSTSVKQDDDNPIPIADVIPRLNIISANRILIE